MDEFCHLLVSATSKEEANGISDVLVKEKLIAGALIIKGPSRYWWNGKIVEREYYNISAFSLMKNRQRIISEVKKIHSDKCPIIALFKMDGNEEFLSWVKESCSQPED